MAWSESSQTWRKKESSLEVEIKSERENSNRSAINRNVQIARNENWRSGIEGNWRSKREENWRSGSDEIWRNRRAENWRTRQTEIWRKEEKSESPRIKEEYSESQIHGCWKILVDTTKESEEVWKSALELHIEQPHLFPVPPKRWAHKISVTMHIECYTPPGSDKEQIQNAAKAIRGKVYFPFIMYYIECPIYTSKPKYLHAPENEFYELEGYAWKIALTENPLGYSGEDTVSNEDLTAYSSLIKIKSPRMLARKDTHSSSSYEIPLPSEVTDDDYIYFPPTEEAKHQMILQKGGKWMIYTGFDMSKHDDIWTAMIPLFEEGACVGLKASTAMITEAEQFMGGGVIHCYTANADDFKDVKKVVDRIRSVLLYNYVLNYKTNYSSEAGRYRKEGCFSVSQYMDTVKGNFYKRDRLGRFSLEGL